MRKVILTRGLPGSGKSTWAKEQVEKYPGRYKVINKDSLRSMLDGGKWSKHNEQFVLKVRNALILLALEEGYHLIIDDTNLHSKHEQAIRDLVKGKAEVTIQDFTNVPIEVCVERDLKRLSSVGETEIRKMYRQFLFVPPAPPTYDPNIPDAVLIDLDGTLAIVTDRSPYDAEKCEQDLVNEVVRDVMINTKAYVILVSGRSELHRPQTERWLMKNAINYSHLFMRAEGDFRNDAIVKREIYERHIAGQYNVKFTIDDRRSVVAVWRSLGLTCLQVAEGDY